MNWSSSREYDQWKTTDTELERALRRPCDRCGHAIGDCICADIHEAEAIRIELANYVHVDTDAEDN